MLDHEEEIPESDRVSEPSAPEVDVEPEAPSVEAAEQPEIPSLDDDSEAPVTSEATSEPFAVEETPVVDEQPAPRPRRRSASRPAGPPAPVEAPQPSTDGPLTRAAADVSPADEPVETEPEQPKPQRRRRATRPTAAPDPVTKPSDDPQEIQVIEVETDLPEAPAEPASVAEEIDAALAAASASRGKRSSRPKKSAEQKQAALDSLAEQIAGSMSATTDDETQEPAPKTSIPSQREAAGDETDESSAEGAEQTGEAEAGDEQASEQQPRRRRRRGGRRRRKSTDRPEGSEDADDESDDTAESSDESTENPAEADEAEEATEPTGEDGSDATESGEVHRRRRRRRRRGEDAGPSDDDPSDVVVKVREPHRSARTDAAIDQVTGIEGSTRMEAKKQRRREGRQAGRRRTPIISEAEFLARRESVERKLVVRQSDEYTELAVLEDNMLVEHYVDRPSATSLIGNIYLGRVQNVLPSMEAAFVDIGRGRNAVIYAGEIDWDQYGEAGQSRKVEEVLKSGQTIVVQVSKDPVGAKGARLTSHISIPGRHVVYSPNGHLSGISRKLPESERHRLRDILGDVLDESESVIVRTAAEGASEEELRRDVSRLKAQWEVIEKKAKQGGAPAQLYAEPELTVRIVRDLFTEDFSQMIVAGNQKSDDMFSTLHEYVSYVSPHLVERVSQWDANKGDIFTQYRIDEQIAKALERKVFLPSGGSLVIDRTEAMTVIDVNTGKFTGSAGNLEATVTANNLEAAEEIVRQLRLRDIGGIIVVDFIDMVLPSNRELLLRRLVECLSRDRTRHQVAEVTSLGLVQMTRKRIGTGLAEAFTEECDHCKGRGFIINDHPVESQAPADGGERTPRRGGRGRGGR